MHHRRVNPWLRPGLLLLGAQSGVVGGWAVLSPRSFYGDFPVFGGSWVNALPPYNEHLIRDVGGLYIGFALLFFIAAFTLEPTLVKSALIAWLPFAALHFFFHATHLEGLTSSEKVLQLMSLGIVALLPLALLWGQRRRGSTFF